MVVHVPLRDSILQHLLWIPKYLLVWQTRSYPKKGKISQDWEFIKRNSKILRHFSRTAQFISSLVVSKLQWQNFLSVLYPRWKKTKHKPGRIAKFAFLKTSKYMIHHFDKKRCFWGIRAKSMGILSNEQAIELR